IVRTQRPTLGIGAQEDKHRQGCEQQRPIAGDSSTASLRQSSQQTQQQNEETRPVMVVFRPGYIGIRVLKGNKWPRLSRFLRSLGCLQRRWGNFIKLGTAKPGPGRLHAIVDLGTGNAAYPKVGCRRL